MWAGQIYMYKEVRAVLFFLSIKNHLTERGKDGTWIDI